MHTDYNKGDFKGFEVDMLRLIAAEMDAEPAYTVALWKDVLHLLQNGDLDIVCSAVTLSTYRLSYLDFTQPYLRFQLCAVMQQQRPIPTLHDLTGMHIGVRVSTEAERYVFNHLHHARLTTANTNDELYGMLGAGLLDAVIDDAPIANARLKIHPGLRLAMFLPNSQSAYAIALKKGNTALKATLDQAIEKLGNTGQFALLLHKWMEGYQLMEE